MRECHFPGLPGGAGTAAALELGLGLGSKGPEGQGCVTGVWPSVRGHNQPRQWSRKGAKGINIHASDLLPVASTG